MAALCWSHMVTTVEWGKHWLHCATAVKDTTHGNLTKPPHLPLRRGHDLWSGPGQRDLAGGACRCSSQFPKSDIWARRRFQSKLLPPQPRAAFFSSPTLLLWGKRPFCTWRFAYLQPSLPPPTSKLCRGGRGHQWSLWTLLHNNLLKDGISTSDSARHSPAPLSKLVRARGPEAKLIVHKLIQPPWFCLFKWDS